MKYKFELYFSWRCTTWVLKSVFRLDIFFSRLPVKYVIVPYSDEPGKGWERRVGRVSFKAPTTQRSAVQSCSVLGDGRSALIYCSRSSFDD